MNKTEFDSMSFNEAIESLYCDGVGDITTRKNLLECAIYNINNDDTSVAIHIINGIDAECVEYYAYDYSMGVLDNVTAIADKEELTDYLDGIRYWD